MSNQNHESHYNVGVPIMPSGSQLRGEPQPSIWTTGRKTPSPPIASPIQNYFSSSPGFTPPIYSNDTIVSSSRGTCGVGPGFVGSSRDCR